MIWLLWTTLALATRVEAEMVSCPIGETPTRVYRLLSKDSFGGWDADGARYAHRGQWREYAVSTCPDNYLSLTSADMKKPLTPEQQVALQPLLDQLATEVSDPEKLEVWDRWLLAARTYEALDADPWQIANVYLQAAWTVRDAAVGVYAEGLHGPSHARAYLVAGAAELKRTDLTPEQKRILSFNLAKLAHRGGFVGERNNLLESLRQSTLNAAEKEALAALERAAILEPQLFERAMPHLQAVADDAQRDETQRLHARYLMAELTRRSGKLEPAALLFEEVQREAEEGAPIRALSAYLAAECRGEQPWTAAKGPLRLEPPTLEPEPTVSETP